MSHLTAQEAAIKSATTSYRATLSRYKNDQALLIEVLSAQNRLINSELNMLLAIIDKMYQLRIWRRQFLTNDEACKSDLFISDNYLFELSEEL